LIVAIHATLLRKLGYEFRTGKATRSWPAITNHSHCHHATQQPFIESLCEKSTVASRCLGQLGPVTFGSVPAASCNAQRNAVGDTRDVYTLHNR